MLNSLWVKNKYKSRIQIETWPTYMIIKYFSYLYLSGILYWRIEKIKLFVAAEKSKASPKNAEKGKDVWGTFQESWCCFLENWLWFDVWWFLISVILWTRAMHPSKKCVKPGVIWISSCSLLQTSVGNSTLWLSVICSPEFLFPYLWHWQSAVYTEHFVLRHILC